MAGCPVWVFQVWPPSSEVTALPLVSWPIIRRLPPWLGAVVGLPAPGAVAGGMRGDGSIRFAMSDPAPTGVTGALSPDEGDGLKAGFVSQGLGASTVVAPLQSVAPVVEGPCDIPPWGS